MILQGGRWGDRREVRDQRIAADRIWPGWRISVRAMVMEDVNDNPFQLTSLHLLLDYFVLKAHFTLLPVDNSTR
jgi:hypothetical protein